jgi:hypothetical protein
LGWGGFQIWPFWQLWVYIWIDEFKKYWSINKSFNLFLNFLWSFKAFYKSL